MDHLADTRPSTAVGAPRGRATFRERTRTSPVVEVSLSLPGGGPSETRARLVATSRETGQRYVSAARVAVETAREGRPVLRAVAALDLRELAAELDPSDAMLDLSFELEDPEGGVESHRVQRPTGGRGRPWGEVERDGAVTQFVPYTTFRASNRSLVVERMDAEVMRELHRWRRRAWLLPLVRPFTGIWLIGELPYKAQDNGFHLFRWLRTTRPDQRAYYVVDRDSPDLARVQALGNVVLRHSAEHVRVAFLANRLVGTHHTEYLLPSRDPRVVNRIRGVRVFIRHGVSGTKNMAGNYGRFAPGFTTDRVHASNEHEREVVITELRYRPAQVRLTGLPRFDQLLAPLEEPPSGVLVIPTWREWISTHEAFETSEYRQAWQSLLRHEGLAEAVRRGLPVTFILHPNMRGFARSFDTPGVRVVTQGEVDVQSLLRSHQLLVTDYSSVGFDFSLLERPVVYFQFDQERFFGPHGSHIDLDRDLPGPIVRDVEGLVAEVLDAERRGFTVSAPYADRARRAVRYHDRRNCERVAHSVATAGGPAVQWWRLVDRSRARARRAARGLLTHLRARVP